MLVYWRVYNGFVFESGIGLPHWSAKRIHPHEMKSLESCYHGDPWISFLGFEGTATSTSTSWVGDFRMVFVMCSLFFPNLGALGFSSYQSGSSQALHGTTVRPGKCTSTLVSFWWRSHEAMVSMGEGTWWSTVGASFQTKPNIYIIWWLIYNILNIN